MGTAEVQGALWGARARDWAEIQEPSWSGVFETVLDCAGIGPGTRLLDIGCGAGGALLCARARGAEIAGLDASENLVAIARERLPEARILLGEMEALPFADESFDAVTGINAFQFAGDVVRALSEARRVCRPGGSVTMLTWGPRDDCELITVTMGAIFALMPATPPAGPPAPQFAAAGVSERLMAEAGLESPDAGTFDADLVFPSQATAVRAILSAAARAIGHAGEERVAKTIAATLPQVTRSDGTVAFRNRFRWTRSSRPAAA